MFSNYQFNPASWGTHKIILSLLGEKKEVLDVGCASGYLGQHDKKKNRFWGIEIDSKQAKIARQKKSYQQVIVADVEKTNLSRLSKNKFDVIVFADILEHLVDPQKTLSFFCQNFLVKYGKVIISLPNVAHLSVRLNLLKGKFDYTKSGILDKTHLHLYTLKSAKELIDKSGLKVEKVVYSSNRFGWLIRRVPFLGTILGFNLIFLCKKESNEHFN